MKVAVISTEKITRKFPGVKTSYFDWTTTKPGSINLRDYDGVIVDIDSFSKVEDQSKIEKSIFEDEIFSPEVVNDVLTSSDSFFVVIGKPTKLIRRKQLASRLGFDLKEVKGNGESLRISSAGPKTVFAQYINKVNQYKYSFETEVEVDDYFMSKYGRNISGYHIVAVMTPLVFTRANHMVAFTLTPHRFHRDSRGYVSNKEDIFQGPLTFLPVLPKGNKASIEAILEIYSSDHPSEAPEWVNGIEVIGQSEIDNTIKAIQDTITTEQEKLQNAIDARQLIRKPIEILYLSDKPLEYALADSFKSSGFKVQEPANPNNVEFYLSLESQDFVVEIKSTEKATFSKEGMRQVNEWRENELLDSGKKYKPLLILSNEYEIEPTIRNTSFIDENLVSFAKIRDIAVVSVVVLYEAFQYIHSGKISVTALSELLFANAGVISQDMVDALLEEAI